MNIAIATTTINPIDLFLDIYTRNLKKYGHEKTVTIYIAGDNKSPVYCDDEAKKYNDQGFQVKYLNIEKQKDYLKKYPELCAVIPENSDNRRNVAYLMALEEGADIVISVDDDNYPDDDFDFVGAHSIVGTQIELPAATGRDGWFNLCSMLLPAEGEEQDKLLYPRGYPYKMKGEGTGTITGLLNKTAAVNVGLWTIDPDTDAIGRLYANPVIKSWTGQNVLLGEKIRCPINTQNTAISRDAMISYYYIRMGYRLKGMRLDRFGDIFSGYFLQLCVDALNQGIKIGSPVAAHIRNKHNLMHDLYNELAGIMILEDMRSFLSDVKLPSRSYCDAYYALSKELENFAFEQKGFIWEDETKAFFRDMAGYMRIWIDVVNSLK